ncbi:MAG: alpha-2-macroglobulin, partial [Chromatiales bacterium]|nr:alpha-2-macroglobulin [Chromatiales bacterium]
GDPVTGGWVLADNRRVLYFPRVAPSSKYVVSLRTGLPAANGSRLAADEEHTVETREMPPAFGFASRGSVLPAKLTDGLPIMSVNVPEVDIEFLRVRDDRLAPFVAEFYRDQNMDLWDLDRMHPLIESVYAARYTTGAKPNTRTVTHIPVEGVKELKRPGFYVAVMREPGRFQYQHKVSHFFVTDIGLHARVYVDAMEVHAASLTDGKPAAGVTVELLDGQSRAVQSAVTDGEGRARFDGVPLHQQVVVARKGEHIAVLAFREPALDLSEFDVAGLPSQPLSAFVYAERDLYRPGETVQISVLLRDRDGRAVPPQPLHATVKRPDGRVMAVHTWQPRELGYYHHALTLPYDAQTGGWSIEVRGDPAASTPTTLFRFKVEEFLPERMKLELDAERAWLEPGDTFIVRVTGSYLYGAPASGNRFKGVLTTSRDAEPLANLPGFVFGDVDDDRQRKREELDEVMLDAKGRHTLRLPQPAERPNSPLRLRLTGELYETGGRPVIRSIQRTVWPAEAMLGIRPTYSGEYAPDNSVAEFEVVRATPEGRLLAAQALDVTVIREERNYFWSYDDARGWRYEFSDAHYPVQRQNLDIPADGRARLDVPVEWGSYRIEIRDAETGLTLRHRFQAGWSYEAAADRARPDRVDLRLDKPAYRAGDTVQLTVTPPHEGEALILVEGDGRLWSKQVHVPAKGRVVEIPIDPAWQRHDLYVSALVLRGGEAKNRITPNRAVGIVHLPLERADRRLDVQIDAPERMLPETPLELRVQLAGLQGQQAMLTVAAVDVGVLAITDYRTPDPWAFFFGKRRFGVDLHDLYGKVIENLDGVRAKLRYGGDADAGGLRQSPRGKAEVRIVSLFTGPVEVDAEGRATVQLDVPDFNGRLRVMAVAFTEDRFGSAETEVTVAAPVVAEIALPRFLANGDSTTLTLDLHNLSGRQQKLALRLAADAPLSMTTATRELTLDDQEKTTLRFDIAGGEAFGVGEIRLALDGQDVSLHRRWELAVRPPWPGERRVTQRRLDAGGRLALDASLLRGLMPDTVEVQLVVSPTPPINLRDAVKGLLGYPYGCLEQTTSGAFPLLYVDETQAQALGLKPLSLAERATRIDQAIARLGGMQLASGGFGLWNNQGPEEGWLTPYVVDFLLEARDQGFGVPEHLLKRALDALERRLQAGGNTLASRRFSDAPAHLSFAANAYAGYVLARVQRAPLGTLRTLYDHQRAQAESGLPLVHLGLALRLMGDEKRAQAALAEGVKKERREKWYLGDYGSDIRDSGLMAALLERHAVEVEGRDALLFRLAGDLPNRRWLSTQERLAAFLAGRSTLAAGGREWNATLDGKTIEAQGRTQRVFDADALRAGVNFTSKADFPLFTEIEVTGYTRQAPAPKLDDIHIQRSLHTPDGKPVGERPLKVGELLIAHLRVESRKTVEDALIVDLLPAGLEIENLNLSQGEAIADLRIEGQRLGDAMQNDNVKHQEYRDDRFAAAVRLTGYGSTHLFYLLRVVSPGRYTVPPPFVEDMYRPELRAVGVSPGMLRVEN